MFADLALIFEQNALTSIVKDRNYCEEWEEANT